ncbi:MAG TPA: hypothetical protein VG406_25380 [Isosphaeraceae bacterium]|jgi:hypothetical protein|nr:hypothetical protein [Isosphaeraceae bacterium]
MFATKDQHRSHAGHGRPSPCPDPECVEGHRETTTHHHDGRLVVTEAECACHSVHTKHVHHRDFPEIWAECSTLAEGIKHLGQQLARALEGARSAWHREAMQHAIDDVDAFHKALDQPAPAPAGPSPKR